MRPLLSIYKTGLFALVAALLLVGPRKTEAAAAYPYPQLVTYSYGFKPASPFSGSWATDATNLMNKWTQWKTNHITTNGAGGGGRMRVQRNAADGNDTVSEGISYGMLLSVYFNDQTTFDALWGYKTLHNDGLGLMNWKITAAGATAWDGNNSATDADEDIAFSLYLAHRQWGSGGTLNYKALADGEVNKIRSYCLDSNRVKPGDAFNSCRYPSYFFPNEYRVFAKETNNAATWDTVRANCYNTIAAARNAGTGLIAEQCTDGGQGGGCSVSSTRYEYNSCRVPFRMALDYVYYGDANAAAQLDKTNVFFGSIAPASVGDGYNITGGARALPG
jgi:endo-1,4-beta-D-glucanase Y